MPTLPAEVEKLRLGKYLFPEELYYDRTHNWVRLEGEEAVQGLTSFGQALAGEILYVEPVPAGRKVRQGEPLLSLESGKWVGRIQSALSGEVLAFNSALLEKPELVNKDPYGAGWLVRLRPSALEAELPALLRAGDPELASLIEAEREKYGL
jgi:glycine cleavage system H protein